MALKKYSFWIEDSQLEALRFVAERDGVRESEQIRRGINMWLEQKGVRSPRQASKKAKKVKS